MNFQGFQDGIEETFRVGQMIVQDKPAFFPFGDRLQERIFSLSQKGMVTLSRTDADTSGINSGIVLRNYVFPLRDNPEPVSSKTVTPFGDKVFQFYADYYKVGEASIC